MSQICPWCETPITWDEEIGPEEACPHCFNELDGYRSIQFKVDTGRNDADGASKRTAGYEPDDEDWDDAEDADDAFPAEELDGDFAAEDEELRNYEEAVEGYLDVQEEIHECISCREDMVLTGQNKLDASTFVPFVPAGKASFLQAPFAVNVYVCPGCFRVEYSLSDEDRVRTIQRHGSGK